MLHSHHSLYDSNLLALNVGKVPMRQVTPVRFLAELLVQTLIHKTTCLSQDVWCSASSLPPNSHLYPLIV